MKVSIRHVEKSQEEQVIIECMEVTGDVEDIRNYAQIKGAVLNGNIGERIYQIRIEDIFYFEAVEKRVFAYTENKVYDIKSRLYQLESDLADRLFCRCSKSVLINLMKLDHIAPALNGRFTATLQNGEKLMVSRQYAASVIRAVQV